MTDFSSRHPLRLRANALLLAMLMGLLALAGLGGCAGTAGGGSATSNSQGEPLTESDEPEGR